MSDRKWRVGTIAPSTIDSFAALCISGGKALTFSDVYGTPNKETLKNIYEIFLGVKKWTENKVKWFMEDFYCLYWPFLFGP
ncbi:hypothetical protein LRS37_02215 [Neobacillus sedimentimangrovi]|uniref:Uncharacterized protein n=1 Tax=Neobacillus sedimentimangrovi TaxID=2699460 RepID=A0ABS8QEQ8_9BACI|nr:hypothetical protein [Neobacillus sedimentimangrovi]